jgi:hypothetical protein
MALEIVFYDSIYKYCPLSAKKSNGFANGTNGVANDKSRSLRGTAFSLSLVLLLSAPIIKIFAVKSKIVLNEFSK